MAFKQVCSSLLVTVACCSVLTMAAPLSYLSDNNQNGFPFGNQGTFTYLNDNPNQVSAVYPLQSGPVNYINNIGSSQVQTIGSYPGVISNVGLGNNVYGSNIISNVNGLSYPSYVQTLPVYNQVVSYPSVSPVAQYVQQPAYIGGPAGYPNTNQQTTNTQTVPVEINYNPGCAGRR